MFAYRERRQKVNKTREGMSSMSRCLMCGEELGIGVSGVNGLCNECAKGIDEVKDYPHGWICPRCGRVHAPWVSGCDCHPDVETWTSGTSEEG